MERFDRDWRPSAANPITNRGGAALGSGSVSKADAFELGSSILHAPVLLHRPMEIGLMRAYACVIAAK